MSQCIQYGYSNYEPSQEFMEGGIILYPNVGEGCYNARGRGGIDRSESIVKDFKLPIYSKGAAFMLNIPKIEAVALISGLMIEMTVFGAEIDLKSAFEDRNACFIVEDLTSGSKLIEHNPERCKVQVPPQSSFKFPAALMGFESAILKSVDQTIKWDGTRHYRAADNMDQTPKTWMENSSIWVTRWLMPQLGRKSIEKYLADFKYGNRDFSGGMEKAWVSSTLKISGYEKLEFLKNFWTGKLGVSSQTQNLTKDVLFIRKTEKEASLYGKTGTGCLQGNTCMSKPDKMLGWFVGYVVNGDRPYAFVANAEDLHPEKKAAGPRLRATVVDLLEQMKLLN